MVLSICTQVIFAQESAIEKPNHTIEKSGDIIQVALPILAFSSTFIWKDDTRPVLQFIKTMGTSILITHGLKRLINKERPNGGNHSFPSGHTSSAFTGAAFMQMRYGWKVGIPAYLLASYVGWTRVHENKHDTWDVVAGAATGILSAYLFTKPFKNKDIKISLVDVNRKGGGVRLSYQF